MSDDQTALLPIQVGRLEGRLGALEQRVDRHEDWVGTKLNTIENKLDVVINVQSRSGGVFSLVKWITGLIVAASGWVLFLKGVGLP